MAQILKFKRPTPGEKHGKKILCQNGLHKWEIAQEKPFDVKQGRLVTLYRCKHCGATKTAAK